MRTQVFPGPWLLSATDPRLETHRERFGSLAPMSVAGLTALATDAAVLGRGGAGFPFAVKLTAASSHRSLRRHVVVNLSEGEPASAKDAGLARTAPHLILDGAALVAGALGVRTVDVVLPGEDDGVAEAIALAVAERASAGEDRKLRWQLHRAAVRFVAGEASAVVELIEGRPNLPVTSWVPTAAEGVRGRPTVLSNGETFAQVAALALSRAAPGSVREPGTRLLGITRAGTVQVREVPHGTPWTDVLTRAELARPVLIGGYHGQWAAPHALVGARVSDASMTGLGLRLGAGVVVPLPDGECPLVFTERIVQYLAGQSAGRCGPCVNGLPALARAFSLLVSGEGEEEVSYYSDLLRGRGACSHPDGTVRLAVSAYSTFADEVAAHRSGSCTADEARRTA